MESYAVRFLSLLLLALSCQPGTHAEVNCGDPGTPLFGEKNGTDFRYGKSVMYSCNLGYKLYGGTTRKCQADGSWSSLLPTCFRVSCPNLQVIPGGCVTVPRWPVYEDQATYACEARFYLQGSRTRNCLYTGEWDAPTPQCKAIACPVLSQIANGQVDLDALKHTARYSCNHGYILHGPATRTCEGTRNGQWSGSEPTCDLVLPSLRSILTTWPENLQGTYTLGQNCQAVVTSEDDGCVIKIRGLPRKCMSLQAIAGKLFSNDSYIGISIASVMPSSVRVQETGVDICDALLHINVTSIKNYELIPTLVNVFDVSLSLKLLIPTSAIQIRISGNFEIGSIKFSVVAMKIDGRITIEGRPIPASKHFNIGHIVTALGQKLISGNTVKNAVSAVGLNNIILKNVVLKSAFLYHGYGVRLAFTAVSWLGNPRIYLTLNSLKELKSSSKGVSIAAEFKNLRLSSLFLKIAKLDISTVPFFGTISFKSLVILFSTIDVGEPLIPYDSDTLMQLTPVVKGIKFLTEIKLSNNSTAVKVQITISNKIVDFDILGDSGISVGAFLDRLVSGISNTVDLPPGFNFQSFIKLNLKRVSYNAVTKSFTLSVVIPEPVVLVPRVIVLKRATLTLNTAKTNDTSSNARGAKVGFQVTSTWSLGSLEIPLTISKPTGSSYFMAESKPKIDIPLGSLIEQFMVSLPFPDLSLQAVQNTGLDRFYITGPYVKLYFASGKVLKIGGTAIIGKWINCQVEVMLGQIGNSFVMATGIAITNVPVLTIITKMMDIPIDLNKLPGSSVLDATDIAMSIASQNIPKIQTLMSFDIAALGDVTLTRGVAFVASFKLPLVCKDQICLTFKRLLGQDAKLILQGRFSPDSVYLAATVPTEIQIYKGINITDVGLEVEIGEARKAIIIKGTLELPNPPLIFIGGFGISNSGVYLQMSMKGVWKKPFGIPFLNIRNLHIKISVVPDPIVLSAIECGGQAKLGLLDNIKAKPIQASVYVGINRVTPLENFFQCFFTALTIRDLLAAFAYYPKLPKSLGSIGFPKGINASFAFQTKVLPNDIVIPQGFYLKGVLTILFLEAHANVKISPSTGIFINLTVDPFNLGKGLVSVSGRSSTMGPRIFVDIGWSPPRAFINIEGRFSVLGLSTYTNLTVDHQGARFEISGSFLDLYSTHLTITTTYASIDTADLEVDGYFREISLTKLEKEIEMEIKNQKRHADRVISDAINKFIEAKKIFEKTLEDKKRAQSNISLTQQAHEHAKHKHQRAHNIHQSKKKIWHTNKAGKETAADRVEEAQKLYDAEIRKVLNTTEKSGCLRCFKEKIPWVRSLVHQLRGRKRVKRYIPWIIGIIIGGLSKSDKCSAMKESCTKMFEESEILINDAKEVVALAKSGMTHADRKFTESLNHVAQAEAELGEAANEVKQAKRAWEKADAFHRFLHGLHLEAQDALNFAEKAFKEAKKVFSFILEVAAKLLKFGLQYIIDIIEFRFSTFLSLAQNSSFNVKVKARIFGFMTELDVSINLSFIRDIVMFLMEKIKEVFKLRRKRSLDDEMLRIHLSRNKIHRGNANPGIVTQK